VTYAVEQYHESRARELRAAQLQTALARAQVQSLQMQLHPHFLFNTLNAIAALMREDVEAADVMIVGLSDLLRAALATATEPEVPLRRELELVQMYLDIQLARLGERLTVRISAAPDTLDLAVPTLLLQPLVENAIRHGASTRPGPASIDVRAFRDDTMLIIEVTDDGPGPPEPMSPGHGLENTRLRLSAAFGPQATLALTRRPMGGATVRVAIPIRV
jgi:two-component system, LytTR family, sensor kinase